VIEHQRIYGESINKDANDFERNFSKSFACKEQSQEATLETPTLMKSRAVEAS
jgi:hypothetical protein